MKNVFINSVLVVFALLVASCGRQPEAKVEVMSFNIRLDHVADSMNNWKYRKDHAAQMIAYYAPDIIGMQEVVKNQLDDLKERLPQYTALGVGRADGEEKGEYCSLFYKTDRFELLKSGNFGLSETPDSIGKKGWDAACERIVTWAVLKDKVSGREIAAFNTHFDHVGKVARRESAVLILEKIKQMAGDLPVIVTRDFNGTVDSEPVTVLTEGGMKNACVTAKVAYGPTWSFHDFGRIPVEKRRLIDFICVKSPLGPFQYAAHNPFCYKPGGFATGAGHGSTVCGPGGIYWHFGTIHLSINYKFERRLCMFPTFFDEDGVMYSDTYFGDYPHYSPDQVSRQTTSGGFRGWMLLSYGKPVKASSQLESYPVENVTDENLKTFWVAGKNDDKQWVEIDLEEVSDVYALQLNFFDYEETGFWGRMPNLRQRYLVEASVDGARWRVLVDYRNSFRDAPHNYIELDQPIEARYIRYRHHYVPGKNLAMGNIRVFGLGRGKKPATVKGFTVVREADERNVRISWKAVKGAQGYNVLWGVAPDKLYSSWMVYGDNSLDLRALTVGQKYYFAIEAFNENGISQRVFLREAH